jgi:putative flippase GtrA
MAAMSRAPAPSLRDHAARLVRFAIVSGTGLALDLIIFLLLVRCIPAFAANIVSSSAAVTFVYFGSVRRVFRYNGRFVPAMFASYALYQLCGILLGSWVVSALVHSGLPPGLAKIAILPVTFGCNYCFMWWLTASPERWVRAR